MRISLLSIAATLLLGCAASPETPTMRPAAGTAPDFKREVNVSLKHGDRFTALDDALVVVDNLGHRNLMLFDGDVSCEDVRRAVGVPRGLVLQTQLDANGNPTSWTFYRNGAAESLAISPNQANYRSGPGGGSMAIATTLDRLPFEVRGSYQPEYCR